VLNGKGGKGPPKKRAEEIAKPNSSPKNLPNLVFVVQFHDPAEPGSAHFAGRAEHVMSGKSTSFETPEDLVDFLRRVMKELKPRSQKGKRQ
jgi:hypothetical protein